MKSMKHFLSLSLAASLLALSAPAELKVLEEIIAKINGEIVTRSELERSVVESRAELTRQGLTGAKLEQALADHQKDVLRDLIDQSLLVQRGKELGISVDANGVK